MALKNLSGCHLKHNMKDTKFQRPLTHLDELAKADKAIQDMKECYASLLSAAAAATTSAHVFSESLREMGDCLVQNIALNNDDEQFGQVMLMLGEAQFKLQKLVNSYRNHVTETITVPSESLMNELHTAEEMKNQCEEKRKVYECMKTKNMEMEKSKSGKEESFSSKQLEAAREELDMVATSFVFRSTSLKHGQSRSLLTLAARHHSAQLSFIKKALKSLKEVEPPVKLVTQQQHINYEFIAIEDDEDELNFDHQSNNRDHRASSVAINNTMKELKPQNASSSKTIKLQRPESGPLTSKTMTTKPSSSVGSSTIIHELHELPRPPSHMNCGRGTHSGRARSSSEPLMMRSSGNSAINICVPKKAYPLPTPPEAIYFSKPLSGSGTVAEPPLSKPLVDSPSSEKSEYTSLSPLLTPR